MNECYKYHLADPVERLDRISEKLSSLRDRVRRCSVLGSGSHMYHLRPPLSDDALSKCEQRLGVNLPVEYRLFLRRIGDGGAGPYYGVFPLDDQDPEDITDREVICKPFRWAEAFNPYDWSDPCNQEDVWCDEDVEQGERRQVFLRIPGARYICHYGCAVRVFLIVTGQCIGEVWRDSQADEAGIIPECSKDGRHMSFLDWYETWLDESSSSLREAQ